MIALVGRAKVLSMAFEQANKAAERIKATDFRSGEALNDSARTYAAIARAMDRDEKFQGDV